MIRRVLLTLPQRVVSLSEIRNASTVSCSKDDTVFHDSQSRGWHVLSAVCVERHPVITPEMTEMESKMFQYLQKKDVEKSKKSDYELRQEREMGVLKHGNKKPEGGIDYTKQEMLTTVEMEDEWNKELAAFKLAPRTYDDTDLRSLDRKLEKHLTLLVKQNIGTHEMFLPPQAIRKPGESMRATAERSLKATCGSDFKVRIYGNAPFGFVKYSYPKKYRTNGIYGARVFYFVAKYLEGDIQEETQYKWLDRQELTESLPTDISKSVFKFLLPE